MSAAHTPSVVIHGIRHHSPACARRVARAIAATPPQAVLVEGPSDFTPRLAELRLAHRLPVALYSYRHSEFGSAQSWYPLLAHSPEWVALQDGHAAGALTAFIDLPHWTWRVRSEEAPTLARWQARHRDRYSHVMHELCAEAACDGSDALWDRWFELAPDDATLDARLHQYFATLRGDEAGEARDQAREAWMADWIALHVLQAEERGDTRPLLVVCGGWHEPALERLWLQRHAARRAAGDLAPPRLETFDLVDPDTDTAVQDVSAARARIGSYIVPTSYRAVDALAGYASGLPSPQYYAWLHEHGATEAARRTMTAITARLRERKQRVGTPALIAWQLALRQLAALRGNPQPARSDVLDSMLTALLDDALDRPPPWQQDGEGLRTLRHDDHPVLREALLALTGEAEGELDAATPLPPLVADLDARLAACELVPTATARTLHLDWRQSADRPRLHLLWQLRILGLDSFRLDADGAAPPAADDAPEPLENWTLQRSTHWHAEAIQAARFGATVASAAHAALAQHMLPDDGQQPDQAAWLARLTDTFNQALRAGFADWGVSLQQRLLAALPGLHDRGVLASLGSTLVRWNKQGFWSDDERLAHVLAAPLHAVVDRLAWLIEGQPAAQSPPAVDIAALRVIGYALTQEHDGAFDHDALRGLCQRLVDDRNAAPALRGAALGVRWHDVTRRGEAAPDPLTALRDTPPRTGLGDFLAGLFACAREVVQQEPALLDALSHTVSELGEDDFLVALPALRGAFAWFSPRERRGIGRSVAQHLGLDARATAQLQHPADAGDLLAARRIEQRALHWLAQLRPPAA